MLEGRKIYITKGVNPEVAVMQRIIAACGGIVSFTDLSFFSSLVLETDSFTVLLR